MNSFSELFFSVVLKIIVMGKDLEGIFFVNILDISDKVPQFWITYSVWLESIHKFFNEFLQLLQIFDFLQSLLQILSC